MEVIKGADDNPIVNIKKRELEEE